METASEIKVDGRHVGRLPERGYKSFTRERKECGCVETIWTDGVVQIQPCETHPRGLRFKCTKCDKQFPNYKRLRLHRYEHAY